MAVNPCDKCGAELERGIEDWSGRCEKCIGNLAVYYRAEFGKMTEFVQWARGMGAVEVKMGDFLVKFGPLSTPAPAQTQQPIPEALLDGWDKMTEQERKTAMEQAERERLLFRSS